MVRIGIDGPDTSHVRLFTEAYDETGVRVVSMLTRDAIRDPLMLQLFAEEHGLKLYEDQRSFADTLDAVLILGVDWSDRIDRSLYYLDAGKRVFLDKPVAGSFPDLIRLRELVSRYPRQMIGGSALPFHPEFTAFLERFRALAEEESAVVEIHGAMDSYFMASHSYELASAFLGDVRDAVVQWGDHIQIHSALGSHETTISLKHAHSDAEHPWSIQARVGGLSLDCSFPLNGIYDGLLHRLSDHLRTGSIWSPGISVDLALAAERSGRTGQPVSIQEIDLGDMIASEAFVAEYRTRFGDRPL